MDRTRRELLLGRIADWFPLLPRTRPPCRALSLRVDEIRGLACSASQGPDEIRLSSAAEALNKAALIASDCGLVDLAQQLCWRQFDIFHAASPLTAKTAKLALQPIVNLGRLATRGDDGARAYRIFENAYNAVRTQAATDIDGNGDLARRITGQIRTWDRDRTTQPTITACPAGTPDDQLPAGVVIDKQHTRLTLSW